MMDDINTFKSKCGMVFTRHEVKSDYMAKLLPKGSIKQSWGFHAPPDTTQFHGVRAIYQSTNAGLDILNDRACWSESQKELIEVINEIEYCRPIEQALNYFNVGGDSTDRFHGISQDGQLEVIFTCNGSHGYCYISFFICC